MKSGLPMWLTVFVVLALTCTFVYNIIVVGPEGLPNSYIIGGLLGAYTGLGEILKRRGGDDDREK